MIIRTLPFVALTLLLSACERAPAPPQLPSELLSTEPIDTAYSEWVDTHSLWYDSITVWQQALDSSAALNHALEQFLAEPDENTLNTARARWYEAHSRIINALPLAAISISNPGLFASLEQHWQAMASYPIEPGYLDSISGYPFSGIVNDISLTINRQALREQHGFTDDSEATLGLHVLEFLLWSDNGERTYRDFVKQTVSDNPELSVINLPQNRRRDLLKLVGVLLQDDLQRLIDAWSNPGSAVAQGYFILPEASRVLLWRRAFSNSLQQQDNHCAFAAEPCPILPGVVDTLIDILAAHPALVENPTRVSEQLSQLQAAISAAAPEDIAGILAQLHAAFSPEGSPKQL